jgi:hypothetical protein
MSATPHFSVNVNTDIRQKSFYLLSEEENALKKLEHRENLWEFYFTFT